MATTTATTTSTIPVAKCSVLRRFRRPPFPEIRAAEWIIDSRAAESMSQVHMMLYVNGTTYNNMIYSSFLVASQSE